MMMRHASDFRRDLTTYALGYGLALFLSGCAFALTFWHLLAKPTAFAVILTLGLIQMVVHMRCFLHIDLKRSARADLQLALFSTLIICLMVSGTFVIIFNLRDRMM